MVHSSSAQAEERRLALRKDSKGVIGIRIPVEAATWPASRHGAETNYTKGLSARGCRWSQPTNATAQSSFFWIIFRVSTDIVYTHSAKHIAWTESLNISCATVAVGYPEGIHSILYSKHTHSRGLVQFELFCGGVRWIPSSGRRVSRHYLEPQYFFCLWRCQRSITHATIRTRGQILSVFWDRKWSSVGDVSPV